MRRKCELAISALFVVHACRGATILNEGYCSSVEPGELYPLPDIQQSGIPVPPIELHPLLPLAEKKKSMIKPKKKSFGGETKHFGQDFECNLREVYHPVCGIIRGELVDYPNEDYAECAYVLMVKLLNAYRKFISELQSVTCHMRSHKLPALTGKRVPP